MNKAYYRKYVEKLILNDPVAFNVIRKRTQDDGYGGEISEDEILPIQQGRLYSNRLPPGYVTDKGKVFSPGTALKLLVVDDVDIAEGDYLPYHGKMLRVAYLQVYDGICKQAELEVVA